MTLPILTALPIHSRCFFAITLSEGKSCPFLIENPSSFGDVAPLVVGRQKGGFSPTSPRPCEGSTIYIRKYVVSHRRTRQRTYSTYRRNSPFPISPFTQSRPRSLDLTRNPLLYRESCTYFFWFPVELPSMLGDLCACLSVPFLRAMEVTGVRLTFVPTAGKKG